MLSRLKRPGYWIVFLAIFTIFFYSLHQKREEERRHRALLTLYRSYGQEILKGLREGNFTGIQQRFADESEGGVSLEDVTLFVTTLHIDRSTKADWKELELKGDSAVLKGELKVDGNTSYPLDMMVVRRGGRLLLRRLHIGPKNLELRRDGFPFRAAPEGNISTP